MGEKIDLPASIAKVIRSAANLDGVLCFGGTTNCRLPIESAWHHAADVPGVYALGMKLGIRYDRGLSKLIYIGSSVSLRKRLQQHHTATHSYLIDEIRRRYPGSLEAAILPVPGISVEWLRGIEGAFLAEMQNVFGRLPICNADSVESMCIEACSPHVRIFQDEDLPFAVSLERMMDQLGTKRLGIPRERKPAEFYEQKNNATSAGQESPTDTLAAQELDRILLDATIYDGHVVLWSTAKFRKLIRMCGELRSAKTRSRSKVQRFEAPCRNVPMPHTWGEVALVQARLVNGTWLPQKRTWLKIVHGKELLGQAILEPFCFRGEDKSDLPQTPSRTSVWDDEKWWKHVDNISGELPDDFMPSKTAIPTIPDVAIDTTEKAEQLRLLQLSLQVESQIAAERDQFELENAIEWDKHQKAHQELLNRIEKSFLEATQ